MRAAARDWPLPDRMWEMFVWLVFVALLSICAREAMGAEPTTKAGHARVTVTETAASPPTAPAAELFEDLAAAEDPALGDHVAAGSLTAGELALIIVFLILLFPVGIILLIVFLLDDD